MTDFNHNKYQASPVVSMQQRHWPDKQLSQAPQWCSVDLRDGNQALIDPMTAAQKHRLFDQLINIGIKHIEVGFPAASQTDYDFIREIIEQNKVPEDVTLQILTPARPELIDRSFEALKGAKKAIVHLYNSTSKVQREQVFKLDKAGIIDIATAGAKRLQEQARLFPDTDWTFQYSPESFTHTELEFAVDICNAVIDVWQPSTDKPIIINLPATVETAMPNVYADQIEWFCRHVNNREALIISLHTHNDRGCAVAAAEMGVLAGADRVEGTLLGNGERTGNMDIITMAMNLYSQGINPELDLSDMDSIIATVKACTNLPVHPRHPYAGELVFTAFSGSHQDAINKCLKQQKTDEAWNVAYLPIDPADLGRNYQEVIRINSQSGKGGIAYVIEQQLGIQLPRWMQIDFSAIVQAETERQARELSQSAIAELFQQQYLSTQSGYTLSSYQLNRDDNTDSLQACFNYLGSEIRINTEAEGGMAAMVKAISALSQQMITIVEYDEHSLKNTDNGNDADALCFIQCNIDGNRFCGVGQSNDVFSASSAALLSAVNQQIKQQKQGAA